MADTMRRWVCGCGGTRFLTPSCDVRICQSCQGVTRLGPGRWWHVGDADLCLVDGLVDRSRSDGAD